MNDPDRRALVAALDSETSNGRREILASAETFAAWLRSADETLHHRLSPELSTLHAWLRMVYSW